MSVNWFCEEKTKKPGEKTGLIDLGSLYFCLDINVLNLSGRKTNMYAEPKDLMKQLGRLIRDARVGRRIRASALAADANISRTTLYGIEQGNPGISAGSYMQVMFLLGIAQQFARCRNK